VLAANPSDIARRDLTLHDVVCGAGARIAAGSQLQRVVLWAGAPVAGALTDSIVTSSGHIVRA